MASVYTNLYFNQPLVVLDTTSAGQTSASLFLYGGFTSLGAARLGGLTSFTNTTQSTDSCTGSVVVSGGVGIQKNLNVGGNVSITGDLYVAGTTTTINTTTIDVEDNTILLNSGDNAALSS